MISGFIYVVATGVILARVGADTEDAILAVCEPGQAAAYEPQGFAVNDATHYVSGGNFLPYPAKPDPSARWNGSTWIETRTVAARKAAKWADMKIAAAAASQAPLTVGGKTFDPTSEQRTDLIGMLSVMGATVKVTLPDDTRITLTKAQVTAVVTAIYAQREAVHDKAIVKKAEIASATGATLDAIAW